MKGAKVLAIMALFAVGYVPAVIAEVSHISIETAAFKQGQLPTLTVNVVTEHHDLSRLTFYLRQIYQDSIVLEKLDVERQGSDVFTLSGKEQLRDPDAALIVSEYRNAKWQQYSPVPLFNPVSPISDHQPVAIKKMKSPASSPIVAQAAPAKVAVQTTPINASVPTTTTKVVAQTPMLAATQELLEGCNILKQPNDSLWKIAVRYRKQWGSNIYGAMLALYEANPQAFYQNKISMLQMESSLRCPPASILVKYQNVAVDRATFDNLVASQQGRGPIVVKAATQVIAEEPLIVEKPVENLVDHSRISTDIPVSDGVNVVKSQIVEPQNVQLCSIDKLPKDNLWRVAVRNHQQLNTNVYGAMLAIFDANPDAFYKQKIYLLMADSHLDCPSNTVLLKYQDAAKDKLTYEALERKQRQS
ncbi:hypothetical protein K8B83_04140 [Shewanella inventionis]|uniref:Uncharacterized protein n=1 Tax=Shewanella inventionis TaxID=1738770 RepID=A0ABQ1JAX3_9GAMM|nr:hypothetical protein [Shewanella inventionis]MCL1158007.1 hypothetical protein [Shewanella inventionis]UAL44051.1 hypothetical protein K8B83_04140 [Shewanella inventionis]GGB62896.1 hypothetical protein GCM10011607_24520 [Shewanella inventionis]